MLRKYIIEPQSRRDTSIISHIIFTTENSCTLKSIAPDYRNRYVFISMHYKGTRHLHNLSRDAILRITTGSIIEVPASIIIAELWLRYILIETPMPCLCWPGRWLPAPRGISHMKPISLNAFRWFAVWALSYDDDTIQLNEVIIHKISEFSLSSLFQITRRLSLCC